MPSDVERLSGEQVSARGKFAIRILATRMNAERLSSRQVSARAVSRLTLSGLKMWRSFRVSRCQHLSSRLDIWKGIRASASAQRCSEYTFAK